MPDYRRMADHLETERLILRPWALTDAEDLSALHAERGAGDFIGYCGLVLEKLDFTRHHTTTEDRGEIVWLTRALSPA